MAWVQIFDELDQEERDDAWRRTRPQRSRLTPDTCFLYLFSYRPDDDVAAEDLRDRFARVSEVSWIKRFRVITLPDENVHYGYFYADVDPLPNPSCLDFLGAVKVPLDTSRPMTADEFRDLETMIYDDFKRMRTDDDGLAVGPEKDALLRAKDYDWDSIVRFIRSYLHDKSYYERVMQNMFINTLDKINKSNTKMYKSGLTRMGEQFPTEVVSQLRDLFRKDTIND